MHLHRLFHVFSILCLVLVCQGARAQASKLVIEEDRQTWRFLADDTSVQEQRLVYRVLSPEGAQSISSIPLSYQDGWQSQELLDAYTLKPDGQRLPVSPDAIQKQSGALGGSTGMTWPELRVWQLKFPDVQVGDRVVLHHKLTQLKPLLPGWRSLSWFANHNINTEKLLVEVQAPKDLALAVETQGVEVSRSEADGLHIQRFTGQVVARPYDPGTSNASTTVERVLVSTLGSNEALADRFAQVVQTKLAPNAALHDIAERETKGLTEPAAKAKALYDWVRKNIRYNAVYLGAGGWVPNDIAHILDTRYGDCKDHMLLLIGLLKEVGVEAIPALVNVGADYALNSVSASFNHVIVYVPSQDLYLDPTGTSVPFGSLPRGVNGKPVLLSRAQGSSVAQTPVLTPERNRVESRSDFQINAEGALQGSVHIAASGQAALWLQDRLAQIPAGKEGEAVRGWLEAAKITGTGTLRFPPLDRDRAEQTLELDVQIPHYVSNPEAGSLRANPSIPNLQVYILDNLGNFSTAQRRFAMPCQPKWVREEFKLQFDPQFSLQRPPKDLAVEGHGMRFNAHYRLDKQVLQGDREFVDRNPSMVCDVALYAQRKPSMQAITKNLHQQLIYQQ
ncbi:MAG: DUF3857 and transglutaminase domain-containing protein [Burkholderiales bacterium]|nr:DUF3857 and transglutaminase domain-containing protein [Burkholderiales bacterium]